MGRAIDYMRETADLPETFYEIFVVDPAYHLMGALPLDRLLRTKRAVLVTAVKSERAHVVKASEDQEEVARMFEHYNLVSAPVVDDAGRLVGVLTVDDIVDVIQEEADEDLRAMAGVGSDEELSAPSPTSPRDGCRGCCQFADRLLRRRHHLPVPGSIEKMVALRADAHRRLHGAMPATRP